MRTHIVTALELFTLVLFAVSAGRALWPFSPALGFAGAGVVVGVAAWWLGRPPKRRDPE